MKKTIMTFFVAGAFLASCSNNGKKAETSDAQKVAVSQSENAVNYSSATAESSIAWRASHLAGVEPRWGKISIKQAEISVTDGIVSNAKVVIDITSLTVDNFGEDTVTMAKLHGHLLSPDFFKAETYPSSTFELTSIASQEGDFNSKVSGNLTILDVTKSISFSANVNVSDESVTIKSEDFAVNRTDWELTYNVEGTVGVPTDYIIANDIGFTIDVTVTK